MRQCIDKWDDLCISRVKGAGDVFTEAELEHETERHVSEFEVDYEVNKVGTIGQMYGQFDAIMRNIGVLPVCNREIITDTFNDLKAVKS